MSFASRHPEGCRLRSERRCSGVPRREVQDWPWLAYMPDRVSRSSRQSDEGRLAARRAMANPADVDVLHSGQAPEPLLATSAESEHDREHPEFSMSRWTAIAPDPQQRSATTVESHILTTIHRTIRETRRSAYHSQTGLYLSTPESMHVDLVCVVESQHESASYATEGERSHLYGHLPGQGASKRHCSRLIPLSDLPAEQ